MFILFLKKLTKTLHGINNGNKFAPLKYRKALKLNN